MSNGCSYLRVGGAMNPQSTGRIVDPARIEFARNMVLRFSA